MRNARRKVLSMGLGSAIGTLLAHIPGASAQSYPAQPLKLIVPFSAGGIVDIIAREMAAQLHPLLKQPVLVENRTGASGSIGIAAVANAAPDGYTLLLASGVITINSAMNRKLPWHPIRSFEPVGMIATSPQVIVVHPQVPAANLQELIAYVRSNPGKLEYGSVGVGSTPHLTIELLKARTGIHLVHIPYRGQTEVVVDLMQGRIAMSSVTLSVVQQHIASGKLRAMAITTSTRSPLLPQVPTVLESGIVDFDVPNWFGVLAPKGTQPAVTARLGSELGKVLVQPEVAAKLDKLGAQANTRSAEEFGKFLQADLERWVRVVDSAGLSDKE